MEPVGDIEIEYDAGGAVVAVWVLAWALDPVTGVSTSTRVAQLVMV